MPRRDDGRHRRQLSSQLPRPYRIGRRLHQLYGVVLVPQQVISELLDPAAPHDVRKWASDLPDWIDVREAAISDDDMTHLDPGERAAIVLALSEPGTLLLIDETAGRMEASRRGIRNTGTLGVVRAAALKDYLDLPTTLARLLETNFRVSMELACCMPRTERGPSVESRDDRVFAAQQLGRDLGGLPVRGRGRLGYRGSKSPRRDTPNSGTLIRPA